MSRAGAAVGAAQLGRAPSHLGNELGAKSGGRRVRGRRALHAVQVLRLQPRQPVPHLLRRRSRGGAGAGVCEPVALGLGPGLAV